MSTYCIIICPYRSLGLPDKESFVLPQKKLNAVHNQSTRVRFSTCLFSHNSYLYLSQGREKYVANLKSVHEINSTGHVQMFFKYIISAMNVQRFA